MNTPTVSRHRVMFVIEYQLGSSGPWLPTCAEFTNHREAIAKLRSLRAIDCKLQSYYPDIHARPDAYRITPTHKAV